MQRWLRNKSNNNKNIRRERRLAVPEADSRNLYEFHRTYVHLSQCFQADVVYDIPAINRTQTSQVLQQSSSI